MKNKGAKKGNLKIDWIQLESEIRSWLREYKKGKWSADYTLSCISDSLGEHTGRGFELDW